mgnify:CR=1 FL=1
MNELSEKESPLGAIARPRARAPRMHDAAAVTPTVSLARSSTLRGVLERRRSAHELLDEYLLEAEVHGAAMPAKVVGEPGFILHAWEWSESSQLLDVLTLHYGRVFMVAKGAKRPSSQMRGLLTQFCPLLFHWSGRREAKSLVRVDWLGSLMPLTGETLMSAFYVNELVLRLCQREEHHPGLFSAYVTVLDALAAGRRDGVQPALRAFERTILTLAGWTPSTEGFPEAQAYVFREGVLCAAQPCTNGNTSAPRHYRREEVEALLQGDFTKKSTQRALRDMLREMIEYHLEHRVLNTRRILAELKELMR